MTETAKNVMIVDHFLNKTRRGILNTKNWGGSDSLWRNCSHNNSNGER